MDWAHGLDWTYWQLSENLRNLKYTKISEHQYLAHCSDLKDNYVTVQHCSVLFLIESRSGQNSNFHIIIRNINIGIGIFICNF